MSFSGREGLFTSKPGPDFEGDTVQPGLGWSVRFPVLPGAIGANEGLLGAVFGSRVIAQHGKQGIEDSLVTGAVLGVGDGGRREKRSGL